jgi:ABC-type lipoprotein release transport system permease subunit
LGQQQLLLIILGVIVVGIAVAVGITMFTDSAINANRDALGNDLVNLAARAQMFYRRPTSLGGGGNSFNLLTTDAITLLTNKPTNGNGSYFIETAGTGSGTNAVVVIKGIGNELFNGSPVALHVFVFPDRDSMVTVN